MFHECIFRQRKVYMHCIYIYDALSELNVQVKLFRINVQAKTSL